MVIAVIGVVGVVVVIERDEAGVAHPRRRRPARVAIPSSIAIAAPCVGPGRRRRRLRTPAQRDILLRPPQPPRTWPHRVMRGRSALAARRALPRVDDGAAPPSGSPSRCRAGPT